MQCTDSKSEKRITRVLFRIFLLAIFSTGCSRSSINHVPAELEHFKKYKGFLSIAHTNDAFVVSLDDNKDGAADHWLYFHSEKSEMVEYMSTVDRNYDGIVDQ